MKPEITKTDGESQVSINYLKRIGIPQETIDEGIRNFIDGKSNKWKCNHLRVNEDLYFDFHTLPLEIQEQIKDSSQLKITKKPYPLPARYLLLLKHAFEVGFKDYLGELTHKVVDDTQLEKTAKKYAVLLKCSEIYIELKCKKGSLIKIFDCLQALEIPYYNNIESFRYKFRKLIGTTDFAEEVIHKACGKSNSARRKVTEWHKLKIVELYKKGLSRVQILEVVNRIYPNHKISYSTLRRYITTEVKNITAEKRYGYDFFKKNLEPYIRRQKPEYKFQVVEADGSRLQIPYLNKNGKIKFLKFFVILDVCTSKVVGFNLNEEETTEMILEAFSMMFDHYHLVPACVITDKSSAITSDRFQEFKEDTNKRYNTLWREHLPDYPNSKGTVENFFRNFHIQIARKYFDYIGLSITASTADHKINKDKVKYVYKNKKSLKSREELILFAAKLIHKWNINISNTKSPQQRFEIADIKDATTISQENIARLCWKKVERKISRSKIQLNGFEYEIIDNENRLKWNSETVDVYYHQKIEDYVFLFSEDTFIEKAKKKRFYNEDSKSKLSKITQNKSFRKYLNDSLKEKQKELEVIESHDPLITMYYEETKDESNSQFENYISKYIISEEVVPEPNFYDNEETPTIQFRDDY